MWWILSFPWVRRRRARRAEAAARAVQQAEHQAAMRRIFEQNGWNGPTRMLDNRPFMTLGQQHRSRRRPRNRGGPKRDDP